MRKIIIMRGLPGSGKSTWIKENELEDYTLCPDNIRKMLCNPVVTLDLPFCSINQNKDVYVWKLLFQILEMRMKEGQFTVIDATTLTADQWNRYKNLIKKYKYRVLVVDFTEMPLEEIKKQNKERWNTTGYVPEWVLDHHYERLQNTNEYINHKQFKVIKPTDLYEYNEFMTMRPLQLDELGCKKVVFIGDIHGCWSALNNYFKDTTPADHPDTFYIFLGDYLDRGFENVEVFKHLYQWKEFENVLLLEGNHETHLKNYQHDEVPENAEKIVFFNETLPQLLDAGITKKDISRFADRLAQCAYLQNKSTYIFACHAGIKGIIESYYSADPYSGDISETKLAIDFEEEYFLTKLNTRQMTHGVGRYSDVDKLAEQWEEYVNLSKSRLSFGKDFKFYQIFGHRNPDQIFPTKVSDHVFCLECGVYDLLNENARLRIVEYDIEKDEFTPLEIFNPKWNYGYENTPNPHTALIKDRMLKVPELIKAKHLHDNVFSFNFTKEAWFCKGWNSLTCTARGLFIDVEKNEVVARSYDKFFNYQERNETKNLDKMLERIHYPVKVYEKYNGFLGILSLYNDEFLFCTKSEDHMSKYRTGREVENDPKTYPQYMAILFKHIFQTTIPEDDQERIKKWLQKNNCSLLFEICDPERDPHIVPYDKTHIVLLDIVYNDIEKPMRLMDYDNLERLGRDVFHLEVKKLVWDIKSEVGMREFIEKMFTDFNEGHEGYVAKDANGFMLKFKTLDYKFWKQMRSLLYIGNNTEYEFHPTFNRSFQWLLYDDCNYPEEMVKKCEEKFNTVIKDLTEKYGKEERDGKMSIAPGFMNREDGSMMSILDIRKNY